MWNALRHPNVLSLLGVTLSDEHFTMVSEWMANGNINEFVKTHRDANQFELVRPSPTADCDCYQSSLPTAQRCR